MGELAVEDSINHTELVNMVTEGVQQVLQHGPVPNQEDVNLASENLEMKEKLALIEQMVNHMQQQMAQAQARPFQQQVQQQHQPYPVNQFQPQQQAQPIPQHQQQYQQQYQQ
eukprot:5285373-Ditylum_brightwellii.AAC.1